MLYISETQDVDDDYEMDNYIRKNYSDEVAEILLDYCEHLIPEYPRLRNNPDNNRFHQILTAHRGADENALRDFLNEDEGRSFPYNYHYFLKYLVWRLADIRSKDGNYPPEMLKLDDFFGLGNMKLFIDLAKENMSDFPFRSIEPMPEDVAEEVGKLVDGYPIYLDKISKPSDSKRSICKNIEGQIGVNNVRQEYSRFDDFFEKMESFIEDNLEEKIPDFRLDAELRVMICRSCLEQAMNPILF